MSKARDKANSTVSNFASTGIDDNADANAITIDSSENIQAGTTSAIDGARITSVSSGAVSLGLNGSGGAAMLVRHPATNQVDLTTTATNSFFTFSTNTVERLRVTSGGDIAFGNTVANTVSNYNNQTGGGFVATDGHFEFATTSNRAAVEIGKNEGTDGQLVAFRKQNTTVGSIGTLSGYLTVGDDVGLLFNNANPSISAFNAATNANRDAAIDIGASNARFRNMYLSGGAYLGGTGSANLLDDYEEGSITGMTVNSGTVTTGDGRYTKIGNRVFFSVNIGTFSDETSSATIAITGLPFTSSANNKASVTVMGRYYYGSSVQVVGYIQNNSNQIYLYAMNGGNWDTIQHSELTSGSANFFLTGHYETT